MGRVVVDVLPTLSGMGSLFELASAFVQLH